MPHAKKKACERQALVFFKMQLSNHDRFSPMHLSCKFYSNIKLLREE